MGSDVNAYNKAKKDLHHHGSKGKHIMLNKPIEHLILTQYHILKGLKLHNMMVQDPNDTKTMT
eukprot:12223867-Ditylum_brightwellii.AAC.1